MKVKRFLVASMCMLLALTSIVSIPVSAKSNAKELTSAFTPKKVEKKKPDKKYIKAQANFSVKLFKKCLSSKKNTLISPTSVMYALSMTANGSDGKTRKEMEKVLGDGMSINTLNKYLAYGLKDLPDSKAGKVKIANSIWCNSLRNDIEVKNLFLKKCLYYYGAQVFKAPFDNNTATDINKWVSDNTDKMIKKLVDDMDDDEFMYIINTVLFNSRWSDTFNKEDTKKYVFNDIKGDKKKVDMMQGRVYSYLKDGDKAKGFAKQYMTKYAFVALMPKKGLDINKYAKTLTGDKLLKILKNDEYAYVDIKLPKFEYEYSKNMNDVLKKLGMKTAFNENKANFTKLATCENKDANPYIGNVVHKTKITLDEEGTKAAAATMVAMEAASCAPVKIKNYKVKLNRPFVMMIIDTETNLPLFMGTVLNINS